MAVAARHRKAGWHAAAALADLGADAEDLKRDIDAIDDRPLVGVLA